MAITVDFGMKIVELKISLKHIVELSLSKLAKFVGMICYSSKITDLKANG